MIERVRAMPPGKDCVSSLIRIVAVICLVALNRTAVASASDSMWVIELTQEDSIVTTLAVTLDKVVCDCSLSDCKGTDEVSERLFTFLRRQQAALVKPDIADFVSTSLTPAAPGFAGGAEDMAKKLSDVFQKSTEVRVDSYYRFGDVAIARLGFKGDFPDPNGIRLIDRSVLLDAAGPKSDDQYSLCSGIDYNLGLTTMPGLKQPALGIKPLGKVQCVLRGPGNDGKEHPATLTFDAWPLGKGVRLTELEVSTKLAKTGNDEADSFLKWYQEVWRSNFGAIAGDTSAIDKSVSAFSKESQDFARMYLTTQGRLAAEHVKTHGRDLWVRYVIDAGPVKYVFCSNGDGKELWQELVLASGGTFKLSNPFMNMGRNLFSHEDFVKHVWDTVHTAN